MKKIFNFKKELPLDDNVSNISSISLDTTFEEDESGVKGTFLVEGNYKTHELSLNKKDFKYELDFNENIENFCEGSINLEVEDFTYDLTDNTLAINIDYEVTYEENENEEEFDEEEFERFLEDHEVDVINLNENEINDENNAIEEIEVDDINLTEEETEEEVPTEEEIREVNIIADETSDDATDVILKTIDKEEKYITYHVYVCEEDDTFESISEKFKTTKEEIREYNDIDEILYGRKIIIPVKDE